MDNGRNNADDMPTGLELPDVPAEAKEALSQFFGTAREVMDRYNHCQLCGANLHFSHVSDFAQNLTQEIARCPECGIKVRRVLHRLQ